MITAGLGIGSIVTRGLGMDGPPAVPAEYLATVCRPEMSSKSIRPEVSTETAKPSLTADAFKPSLKTGC